MKNKDIKFLADNFHIHEDNPKWLDWIITRFFCKVCRYKRNNKLCTA